MTDETRDLTADEKHTAYFLSLVLNLRQAAQDLLENKDGEGVRSIVDTLQALEAKTRGNLDDREAVVLRELLSELQIAAVKASSVSGPEPDEPAPGGDES